MAPWHSRATAGGCSNTRRPSTMREADIAALGPSVARQAARRRRYVALEAAAHGAARAGAGTNVMAMLHEAMSAYNCDSCDKELRGRQHECKHIVVQVPGTGDCNDVQGHDGNLGYDGLDDDNCTLRRQLRTGCAFKVAGDFILKLPGPDGFADDAVLMPVDVRGFTAKVDSIEAESTERACIALERECGALREAAAAARLEADRLRAEERSLRRSRHGRDAPLQRPSDLLAIEQECQRVQAASASLQRRVALETALGPATAALRR
ncbi:unnamed protein product, partial [Prorocentrum cordatum]